MWGSCNQGSHPAQIKPALRLWGQQTAETSGHHTRARRAVRGESAALGLCQPRGGGVATWADFPVGIGGPEACNGQEGARGSLGVS